MLFCRAGFSVKTILLDNAEEIISSEILRDITGHSPWSKSYKPNWVKTVIKYPLCVIIEPSEEFQKSIFYENDKDNQNNSEINNNDIFSNYIKENCESIKILQKIESIENVYKDDIRKQIITISDNPLKIRASFEKIISEAVRFIASKSLEDNISYCFKGDFSKIDYRNELEKALFNAGFSFKSPNDENDKEQIEPKVIVTNNTKEIEIILESPQDNISPSQNKIYIFKHKNGLLLTDFIETRLFPDFSCQSCYLRLAEYLKVALNRQ